MGKTDITINFCFEKELPKLCSTYVLLFSMCICMCMCVPEWLCSLKCFAGFVHLVYVFFVLMCTRAWACTLMFVWRNRWRSDLVCAIEKSPYVFAGSTKCKHTVLHREQKYRYSGRCEGLSALMFAVLCCVTVRWNKDTGLLKLKRCGIDHGKDPVWVSILHFYMHVIAFWSR